MSWSMKPKSNDQSDHPCAPKAGRPEAAERRRLKQLVDQLAAHPKLLDEVEKLLGWAAGGDPAQPLASADAVEDQVVESVRQLGNQTLGEWAASAQARALEKCREKHPTARVKKKSS
jgi:hypothetical protein